MKRMLLIVFALLLALPLFAQVDGESYYKKKQDHHIAVGIKGGLYLPHYYYGDGSDLNALHDSLLLRIRPIAGIQCEIPVGYNAYFAPELLWIKRGDFRIFQNVPLNGTVNYCAKVNYLDLRLPLEVTLYNEKKLNPYLFAGLDFGVVLPYIDSLPFVGEVDMNLSGEISSDANEVDVNSSNMAPFDFGVFGGVGLRYTLDFDRWSLVLKLEAAYSMGLLNTYSEKEITSQAPAANLGNGGTHYSVGRRFNRGLECTFGVMLPLHFKGGDACSSFDSVYGGKKRGRSSSF